MKEVIVPIKKTQLQPKIHSSAKRKLVTDDKDSDKNDGPGSKKDGSGAGVGGKKKKKSDKKLLSFNEDE